MKEGICGLYRFKDMNDNIIYIGKANDINKRLKNHEHLSEQCYNEIATIEYTVIDNKADRDILEIYFITKLKPKYNQQSKYLEYPTLIKIDMNLYWYPISIDEYDFIKQHRLYIQHKTNSDIMGRPKIQMPDNFEQLCEEYLNGKICGRHIYEDILHVSKSTFMRRVREYKIKKQVIDNP